VTELAPIDVIGSTERVFSRPSWADPLFMVNGNQWTKKTFTTVANTPSKFLSNNPLRWGFICLTYSAPAADVFLSPMPDSLIRGWLLNATTNEKRFVIFDYGSLVTSEWYAFSTGAVAFGVIEITILQ
jgi:hypothetical protein